METTVSNGERVRTYVRITVADPQIVDISFWRRRYATYLITIQTNHWAFTLNESTTRRRYAEFMWLRRQILRHHPNMRLPQLPPMKIFTFNRLDQDFLQNRCQGLTAFLKKLTRSPVCLSESVFHFFLQSDLTTRQIHANLKGERHDDIPFINPICHLVPTEAASFETDGITNISATLEEVPVCDYDQVQHVEPIHCNAHEKSEQLLEELVSHSVDSGRSSRCGGDYFYVLKSSTSESSLSSDMQVQDGSYCENYRASIRTTYYDKNTAINNFVPAPLVCV